MYPPQHFNILGIDPGTDTLGVSLLGFDLADHTLTLHEARTYRASDRLDPFSIMALSHGERYARMTLLCQALAGLMERTRPHAIISEAPFLGRFPQSFEALVQCVNMIRTTVYQYNPAFTLETVDPPSAKKAVGAVVSGPDKKESVRQAILRLPIACAPGVHLGALDEHTIDSLAVAIFKAKQIRRAYGGTATSW